MIRWTSQLLQPVAPASNHEAVINQQANKIASLDRLVQALLSKEKIDERPELEFEKVTEGVVAKGIISWSAASDDEVKGRN
jgi:hypothetical protein